MTSFVGRAFTVFVVGMLLLLGTLLALLPGGGTQGGRGAFSPDGEGRLPAFLLLNELGFRAERWRDAPGRLPAGDHLLLLPEVPEAPPGYETPEDDDPDGTDPDAAVPAGPDPHRSGRQREPLHYLRFLEEGGTILAGVDLERAEFFADTLFLTALEDLYITDLSEADAAGGRAILRSGEELALSMDFGGRFDAASLPPAFEVLAVDEEDRVVAVQHDVGRGRLVLLPQDDFLGRTWIEDADHALLLVRLVEEIAPTGRILFDDYALGNWAPDSPLQLALAPGRFVLSFHAMLALALAVWMIAWALVFPRDPEPLRQLSPLARVRTYAATIARFGRWDLAARLLREGVLRRLAARSGIRLAPRDGAVGDPGADEIEPILSPLDPHFADEAARGRARRLFLDRNVETEEDLERLGRELADLEAVTSPDVSTKRTRHPWMRPRKS